MREIKFRAKRIDMDRWVYGQYVITPLTDENSGTTPDVGWFFLTGKTRHCIVQNGVAFVIDVETLGQYTGIKDKNVKEIYEGDIVRDYWDGYLWKVVKDDYARFVLKSIGSPHAEWLMFDEFEQEKPNEFGLEVMGNIHQHPHLLEGEQA